MYTYARVCVCLCVCVFHDMTYAIPHRYCSSFIFLLVGSSVGYMYIYIYRILNDALSHRSVMLLRSSLKRLGGEQQKG